MIKCRGIFKSHKNSVQKRKFYGESCDVIDPILKSFVEEVMGYLMENFLPSKKSKTKRESYYR